MALWQFSNKNKYGNWRSRIVYLEGALSHPGGAFGKAVSARRFKYEYNHPVMPPTIFKHNGKTYLMPNDLIILSDSDEIPDLKIHFVQTDTNKKLYFIIAFMLFVSSFFLFHSKRII